MFLCFGFITIPLILSLKSLSVIPLLKFFYVLDIKSIVLILIVLWYVLLYLPTISSDL